LVAAQHAGGGKASQYFLRGFDIDHGTDLRLMVDDIPINMPSHGHGQGYADLHFLIPELIGRIDVDKGPYYAEHGDFATAGAVNYRTALQLPEAQLSVTAGRFGVLRGLAIVPARVEEYELTLAGEGYTQAGPFQAPEDLRRGNLYVRLRRPLGAGAYASMTATNMLGSWNASGQVPLRELTSGRLSRFGSLDPTEGGNTQHSSLSARLEATEKRDTGYDQVAVTLYLLRYRWNLFSNFTFFARDAVNGDQIEQADERTTLGSDLKLTLNRRLGSMRSTLRFGIQTRSDNIRNGLYATTARDRRDTFASADVAESSLALFADETLAPWRWLSVNAGVRADLFAVGVEDLSAPPAVQTSTGTQTAQLVSPKLTLSFYPVKELSTFIQLGRGFHSNDARGATRLTDKATLLTPATGYEVGARIRPLPNLHCSVTAFGLDLESEQVYVGDAGTTEPSAASRRLGVESHASWTTFAWLTLDANITLTRARFRRVGAEDVVPLAPTRTAGGGVTASKEGFGLATLRLRQLAPRPATEDRRLVADGYTLLSARLARRFQRFELAADFDNLLGSTWREVQFATESQLKDETEPVDEVHLVPGWPLSAQVTVSAFF
jgi:outer membrane receptor protein involved in Fe transport